MLNRALSLYKSSFTGLSPQTWSLSLILLVNRSGTMVVPFLTLYLTTKEMGCTLSQAGTVMGLFGFGSVIGAYLGGKLSDRIGFHKVQLLSLLLGGLMFIILGQVKAYELICVTTFFLSMVNEAFRPANSSAIAYYSTPENRTRSYSLNRLAVNLGWAVGASIGGIIASYNYELLFWVDGITNMAAAIVLFLSFKMPKIKSKSFDEETEIKKGESAYQDKTYLWYIFLVILFGLCFFQLFTTVPKYFRDGLMLNEKYIGFLMAINGLLIVVLEMVMIYKMEGKRNIAVFMSLGTVICAFAFLSLLLPGPAKWISLLMILIITIGEIVAMPFMNTYWTTRSKAHNRGQYAALFTMAWGIGQTFGPYIIAVIIDNTNYAIAFIVVALVFLITALGFWKLPKY
jgi:predicted MFS family arabinose efflux permease